MLRGCAAIGLALFALLGAAADEVAVPPLQARVTDLTATLTPEQASTLEGDLAQFEAAHGSQIAILIVPTTQPEAIEQYSLRVAEAWKIGRKGVADGVIVLVAKNDRKLRIEVGRGLEGALPDAIAKRIVAEVIGPRFKADDFYGGLRAGVARIESVLQGEALPPPRGASNGRQGGARPDYGNWLVIGLVVATVLGGILSRVMGRLGGSTTTAGIVGGLAWFVTTSALSAVIAAVLVFFFALVSGGRGGGLGGIGGLGGLGGFGGGGSSGGGGFSGGGGDFGGGGASGSW